MVILPQRHTVQMHDGVTLQKTRIDDLPSCTGYDGGLAF